MKLSKIWDKIKSPCGVWLVLFYLLFFGVVGLTIALLVTTDGQSIIHFVLYGVSAVMLVYFVYTIVYFAPKIKRGIIKLLKKNSITAEMLENYGYRTIIFSICSFVINLSYVAFQGVLAFVTMSVWYISITMYYIVLSAMKGNVFWAKKRSGDNNSQLRTYRATGIMLMFLTVAFSGIIVLIYKSNMYFEYAGLMIYVVSAYTFYKLIMAIYNIFKARKHDDLYVQTIRNINFASALVSIVVLQVAMFQAFSPENNKSFANALTGGGVSALILAIAIYMVVKANKLLKQEKNNNEKQ